MPRTAASKDVLLSTRGRKTRPTAGSGRSKKVQAPRQDRSRQTFDRLLDATERLLEKKSFEAITVAEIVRQAKSSVGSFYARFPTKEALLPALYERYDAGFRAEGVQFLQRLQARQPSIEAKAAQVVGAIITFFEQHRWLMHAMAIYARQHPEQIDTDTRTHRHDYHQQLVKVFMLHEAEFDHPRPREAIVLGLFMVTGVIRERVVFGEAPYAGTFSLSTAALKKEMIRALLGYLGVRSDDGTSRVHRVSRGKGATR